MKIQGRTQVRDSAVAYFAETVLREKKKEHPNTPENPGSVQIPIVPFSSHEPEEDCSRGPRSRAYGSVGGNDSASARQDLINNTRPPTQTALNNTSSYKAGRAAIKLIDLVLILPADFALSVTKGFHNAPKLYHDSMVREFPTVRSIRSGIRTASIVIIQIQVYLESFLC